MKIYFEKLSDGDMYELYTEAVGLIDGKWLPENSKINKMLDDINHNKFDMTTSDMINLIFKEISSRWHRNFITNLMKD